MAGPCRRSIASEGGHFFQVFLRRGIERLHLVEFFRRQCWEMTNKVDQLPTVLVLRRVTLSPGRHRGEPNTVVDDPKHLSIRHRLGVGQSQVGCLRIHVLADGGVPTAVVGMAGRAVIGEMRQRLFHHVGAHRNRVRRVALFERDRQMADLPRCDDLQGMRLGLGAKAGREQLIRHPSEADDSKRQYNG